MERGERKGRMRSKKKEVRGKEIDGVAVAKIWSLFLKNVFVHIIAKLSFCYLRATLYVQIKRITLLLLLKSVREQKLIEII